MAARTPEVFSKTDQFIARTAVGGGKSASSVMSAFAKGDAENLKGTPPRKESTTMPKILIAESKRLAGRCDVVGTTVFQFDKDGICRIASVANVQHDFDHLVRKNGIRDITPPDVAPASAPAPAAAAPAAVAQEAAANAAAAVDIAPPGADTSEVTEVAPAAPVADQEQPIPADSAEAAPKKSKKR